MTHFTLLIRVSCRGSLAFAATVLIGCVTGAPQQQTYAQSQDGPGGYSSASLEDNQAFTDENGDESAAQEKEPKKNLGKEAEDEAKLASEDPKEFLALKGLSDRNGTWLLEEEAQLKQRMSRVKLMQKGLKKQIRKVTKSDRERFQEMVKTFEKVHKELVDYFEANKGKSLPAEEVKRFNDFKKKHDDLATTLQSAQAKILTNEDDIRRTKLELQKLAVEMVKIYNTAGEKYATLQQDANVNVALQKAKGTLGPSSLHRDARKVILSIEKLLHPKK